MALPFWPLVGVLVVVLYLLQRPPASSLRHIPTVKHKAYLPDFINRLIYYPKAASMISEGYEKYKDSPFRLLTGDGEVIILPVKYQEELRHLPPSKLSSLHAQYENALGQYTNIIIDTLFPHFRPHKRPEKLIYIYQIGRVVPGIIDELRAAFDTALPGCEGVLNTDTWIRINPCEMFTRLIALSTSRMMAGDVLRENQEWLNVASNYAVNVGITILLLRPVPKYLRPIVAPFLPSVRMMKKQLRFAKDLFIPMIHERRLAEQAKDPNYTKPDDFLQWMMDLGGERDEDLEPETLAHHMLLLVTLAVTHTSTMALCHCLFDLVTKPEYIEPLREEMSRTLPDGWYNATQAALKEQSRLDSFLRESQRFAPPGELNFHRIVKEPITLHDGLVLPVETHICFAAGPISKDSAYIKDPKTFDGFRWCHNPRDRFVLTPKLAKPNSMPNGADEEMQAEKHASSAYFVSITNTNMHFGFGIQACPGRFFAANTLKAILSRIILDYEFKFVKDLKGKRPSNLVVGEHILPNMSTEMLFRKRPIGV
ncbi:Cytochrome P450 [Penicillium expansum]|uniref:Cytochrome P450 n=1 Tax=Penicillium expansum TaxID=27334 RepID=A0A0A2IT86_PENEN|nr:Cytochrome P450 [Penicillium expansum]KGO43415.1 Cytochrome P450 [Penicillium expansum]KGO57359.1 Cytochrome P450 [Penicillium expansum]KGO71546.1 Cytochrome P450 [Penicillium expansum]